MSEHLPDVPAPTAPRVSNCPKAGTPTPDIGCSARGAVGSLRELHLFAGAGGGILGGLLLGHTPVCAKAERGYWNSECYLRIPAEEYAKMAKGVPYRLEPASQRGECRWFVEDGVRITRR